MKRFSILTLLACLLLASCQTSSPTEIPPTAISPTATRPAPAPTITPKPRTIFKATPTPSPPPTITPTPSATLTPTRVAIANSAPPMWNVPYSDASAPNPNSVALDIYPTDAVNCPVMIFVHGGGWWQGDKSIVEQKPTAFNYNGFVFVSVNYRLIPEVDVRQELRDVAAAIAWVEQNIAQYGGDPNHLFLMGHSAGAHLVSLIGTDETYLEEQRLSLADIKGVVSLDTRAYDIHLLLSNMPDSNGSMYRIAFSDDPDNWIRYSPIKYVASNNPIPPFALAYSNDQIDYHILTDRFASALEAAGVPVIVIPATEKSHEQINAEFGMDGDKVSETVFDWLEKILEGIP